MVSLKGEKVSLYGNALKVGDYAPVINLVNSDFSSIKVGGASGKYQLISVIPSIDGSVCQIQTKKFHEKVAKLSNVDTFCISADIPFALSRFCVASSVDNIKTLSDFRDKIFGKVYGLLLTSGLFAGLLTRAVIVIDKNGFIKYQEICSDIINEPDYDKALEALK